MRKKAVSLFVLFVLLGTVSVTPSFADTLSVTLSNSFEEKSVELTTGQSADVSVHLASVGQPVEGFRVFLVEMRNASKPQTRFATSDRFGVARFAQVPPGRYVALLSKPPGKKSDSATVKLADVVITVGRAEVSSQAPQLTLPETKEE